MVDDDDYDYLDPDEELAERLANVEQLLAQAWEAEQETGQYDDDEAPDHRGD